MITALNNSRVKALTALNQKAKMRREEGLFLVEGTKMFLEAPIEKVKEVYLSLSYAEKTAKENENVKCKLNNCHMEVVSDEVFAKISDTKTPQGVLCVMEQFQYSMGEILKQESPFLMLLEDIQDPGNLGTILRAGEGAGITGVIMSRETVDIYNAKTIRATMGSIFRVPFCYTEDFQSSMRLIQEQNIRIYAAHLQGRKSYEEYNFTEPVAFMIGNEGSGLKEKTAEMADSYLKIPMLGQVESLNAAVASSVLMYETARQRRQKTKNKGE